ncbi:amphi-Trp domain-containing protein [Haloarcula japonica]|uniref:amphi-Trp domain-containing protein n=1 Tax=Haloarcula japonica TaxID=29282 RepID=UPI0039F66A8D
MSLNTIESSETKTREEAAEQLQQIAEKIEEGEPVNLSKDGRSLSLELPNTVEMGISAEEKTSGSGEFEEAQLTFVLNWDEPAEETGFQIG